MRRGNKERGEVGRGEEMRRGDKERLVNVQENMRGKWRASKKRKGKQRGGNKEGRQGEETRERGKGNMKGEAMMKGD